MDHRARAHSTRLQCHIKLTIGQAVIPKRLRGGTHRDNLCMCGRIQVAQDAVLPAPDDLAVWKYLREHIQRDAVVGIIEGGNEHQAICNIEVRVTGGQPLSLKDYRRRHWKLNYLEGTSMKISR